MAQRFDREAGTATAPSGDAPEELPIGVLVQRASEQTTTLVRQELQLAQLELTRKAKNAAIGAGSFAVAGVVAVFGVGALVTTAIAALATTLDTWLAALIVTGALFLVAGVAALVGLKKVRKATPPMPERTIESVQEDVGEIKARAHHG